MTELVPVIFLVQRFCPEGDATPRLQEYPLQVRAGMTILDGLLQVRERLDPTLDRAKAWLIRNNSAVMAVLIVGFGTSLLGDAIQILA